MAEHPGVMDRAIMEVMTGRAIGELYHLKRAEPDRARILQALQRGRGRGRDEIAPDQRAAGHHLAGVIIHVLVRQRHAMQRAAVVALCQRRVGFIGRFQRGFRLERHERIETGLPLGDAMQAGTRHLMRRQLLRGDRLRDLGQRHQGRLIAHFTTFMACASRKLAGSRSNGSVPAIASNPSNAGPIEPAMRVATSASTGTPPTSAIAFTSFGLGLVMLRSLPCSLLWPARDCGPSLEWPCSTPPDAPLYPVR